MKQNEIEILSNSHQMSKEKMDQYKKKLDKLEVEVNELRSRAQKAEREKGKHLF
jgi:peptidoglycan hydrolase CwlO-like protein